MTTSLAAAPSPIGRLGSLRSKNPPSRLVVTPRKLVRNKQRASMRCEGFLSWLNDLLTTNLTIETEDAVTPEESWVRMCRSIRFLHPGDFFTRFERWEISVPTLYVKYKSHPIIF